MHEIVKRNDKGIDYVKSLFVRVEKVTSSVFKQTL